MELLTSRLLFFMLLISNVVGRLISTDEVETLFKKFVRQKLTQEEQNILQEIFEIAYFPDHVTSAGSLEFKSLSRTTIACVVCRSAFAAVLDAVSAGDSDEQISSAISVLCYTLGIENEKVCNGAVALNIPIITYIFKNAPDATPQAFCSFVLQTATNPTACPTNDSRFEWEVELPPVPSVTNTISSEDDAKPLKIAIITDSHIDPLYEAYGVANCDEPVCCRKGQQPARSHLTKATVDETLIQESIINNNGEIYINTDLAPRIKEQRRLFGSRYAHTPLSAEPAGYWGDYRYCDTPLWAFDDAIDTITENHKDVDVVYYVGDTIDHGVWETTYDLINEMNLYIVDKLRKSFGDNVPIVPVIGNHESQPTNQFAPSYVTGAKLNTTWLYDALAEKWDFYLTEEAKQSLRESGDFSLLVKPRLRVISINNNVAYRYNWWLVFDPEDGKRHLDWLVQELTKAELAGEKVHILAHIPPGVHDLQYTWTREYNRIVNRFSSIITAEFNGHLHSDEFKIFYNHNNTPINVAWGAGGVTSYQNYNLNYKIATFNPTSYEPIDIANLIYNLTEANLTPNQRPRWFQLYAVKQRFGLTDLSPNSINTLVYRMVTDSKHLLDLYAVFLSKISDTRWPYCDNNCKIDSLCRTVITVLWNRNRCEELRRLYFS